MSTKLKIAAAVAEQFCFRLVPVLNMNPCRW